MPSMRFLLWTWPLCLAVRQRTALPRKIACVGDSLTAGYPFDSERGNDPAVSGYPYHLQQLLQNHEVKNFGKGETTVVSGSKSYQSAWYNSTWQDALAFNPDQVLLMFGANDVKESRLSKFQTEFEEAYGKLIGSFLNLSPRPEVYLLIPPPMYDNNIYGPEFDPPGRAGGMQQTIFNEQLPSKLRHLAELWQIQTIDLHQCFLKHDTCGDVHVNCCDWETAKPPRRTVRSAQSTASRESSVCLAHEDAIHPNDEGYRNIALMLKRVLTEDLKPCD